MAAMAAVDLGAQSGRVALGALDGGRLTLTEVHRFPNDAVQAAGRLEWDARRLYGDVLAGLRAAAREAPIDSVAVDSWGVDFGLLDRDGELVRNPVHYRDSRRAAAADLVYERVPPRELYERTGIQLMPINTVFELAAMAADGDPALEDAERLLLIPDLFHHWLCGSQTTELTNATTTQCLDARARDWAIDLLDRLDVPTRLFPDVVDPATQLGPVKVESSGVRGAMVVAAATHDTASAVAGTPLGESSAFLSIGTWSLVGVESPLPVVGEAAYRANVTNEGGVAGTFRVLRNVTGMWLLEESRRTWAAEGAARSLEELLAEARSAEPLRSLVDPNDPRFGSPGDMPGRIGDYCVETRQPRPEDRGAVVRCILESLALKHAETVDLVSDVTARRVDQLNVVGGGARNPLLCQWTADATGLPVVAGPAEATVVGNLLVQAMALGELGSLAEAREVVRASFELEVYEPRDLAPWQEARERVARLRADDRMLTEAEA